MSEKFKTVLVLTALKNAQQMKHVWCSSGFTKEDQVRNFIFKSEKVVVHITNRDNYVFTSSKSIYTIIESIRGCYPKNQTLPGLSGSLIPPRSRCSFLPRRRSPVKVMKI